MPKELIKKGYTGLSIQTPNFNTQYGFNSLNTSLPSNITESWNSLKDQFRNDQLGNGLKLMQSSDPQAREFGQSVIEEVLPSGETEDKLSFMDKFSNSTFGQNAQTWSAAADTANSIMTGIVGNKMFGGPKGHITQSIDQGWNDVSDIDMKFGPVGSFVGLGMKGINVLNKGVNAALGSKALDNMTTADAALNNPLLGWNVGLVNALGGQNADTITKDEEVQETVGSSYTGAFGKVDEALTKSGKRYGLFSSGARKDANAQIAEAKRQQQVMTNIADEATDRFAIRNSMSAINGNRRAFAMQGGYNQANVRVGREGMAIVKRVVSRYNIQEKRKTIPSSKVELIEEFKEGGSLNITSILVEVDIDSLPEEFKDGGILGSTIIKEVEIDELIEEFKEGGAFNVIPDGALHARLHHMENSENLTKKGIPVVSEKEGGELEQQAEIEKEEIIYRISVTKKLEELLKQYESDEYSQEEKDQFAIEAGKLLVQETLYNTADNTGLIDKIN